jgi:hypothetical protein
VILRIVLGLSLALVAAPVMAQTLEEFVSKHDGATSCWQRIYSQTHLSEHPDQQVAAMTLGLIQKAGDNAEEDGVVLFGLSASLRDGTNGETSGICAREADGAVRCGVECDGGGVMIERRDGANLLADLESTGFIRMESACGGGENTSFSINSGIDDKQFLLQRVEAKLCRGIIPDW